MTVKIVISMGKGDFGPHPDLELGRILYELVPNIIHTVCLGQVIALKDRNGNMVGKFEVTED